MTQLAYQLHQRFKEAVQRSYPELAPADILPLVDVTQSTQDKFGHYQCNAAMKLAKALKLNPRAIAERIAANVERNDEDGKLMIAALEIAGAGFINVVFDTGYLARQVTAVLKDPRLGIDLPHQPKRVIVDFSSPNIAKEPHVGHLRSTIIGDCLARLFEFLGEDVLRLNHVGDWGTAFGMLIAYMHEEYPGVLSGTQKTDLSHLMEWYRASKKRFDEDDEFKQRARLQVVALQSGELQSLRAWKIICEISRRALQEIYDLLDVRIEERGESFYNPMLAKTIEDLTAKGLIQVSDGAKCLFVDGFQNRDGEPLPLILQKSDGGYTYDTTDMAALYHRCKEEEGDRLIYVVDAGQSTHFQMIFRAGVQAGYYDSAVTEVTHVPFGLVLGTDGKKFRTRSGETERLIDLLQAAIDHADRILQERSPDLPEGERKDLAHALGIGAVKYADLSCHRTGDYVFSYDRMLRFEGNTAAFIMYSYVRIEGIKRKVGVNVSTLIPKGSIQLEHPSEIDLALYLLQFHETLDGMARELLPSRLTDYLFGLAEKFNAFFRDCRVEGSAQQTSRLLLCDVVGRTLKQGLSILGIRTVERM